MAGEAAGLSCLQDERDGCGSAATSNLQITVLTKRSSGWLYTPGKVIAEVCVAAGSCRSAHNEL